MKKKKVKRLSSSSLNEQKRSYTYTELVNRKGGTPSILFSRLSIFLYVRVCVFVCYLRRPPCSPRKVDTDPSLASSHTCVLPATCQREYTAL